MRSPLLMLLGRWVVLGLGVALAAAVVPGIAYDDGGTLILVVVVLGLFNLFLKPLLVFFTLPFVVITMGMGIWLINALLLMGAERLIVGFEVAGFGSALLGALIISVTNLVASKLIIDATRPGRGPGPGPGPRSGRGPPERRGDDVIDI